MSYLSREAVLALGFKSIGESVLISDKCSIYNAKNISIKDNVRIDDFAILSAGDGIEIHNNVHIGCYSSLIGKGVIQIGAYTAISGRVSIYSSTDDFHGGWHGWKVPEEFSHVKHDGVIIHRYCVIGSGSVILPSTSIDDNVAIGAMSLVKGVFLSDSIYAGVPCVKIGFRNKKCYGESA